MLKPFSHIYIEKQLLGTESANTILSHFHNSTIVEINHYKDVFCRSRQDFSLQKTSPALILAEKKGELIYEGAGVCQSFGNEHFYYTSCIMNCIYGCEYCYLSGMYPSGNIVFFLNTEDYFTQVRKILEKNPVYLCISYDTDLLAFNPLTGILNKWIAFADSTEGLTLEIRTKCGNLASVRDSLKNCRHPERIIFAYTLSPESIISEYEKGTASLKSRLKAVKELQELDIPCRLAFDPMIYVPEWKKIYGETADAVFKGAEGCEHPEPGRIFDVSVGSFRISEAYLKNMRKNAPDSAVVQYPFENENGVYHYPTRLMKEMENYMVERCGEYIPQDKIFLWE